MTAVETVTAATAFLSDIRVWSGEMKLAARRWLKNFTPDEQEHAAALLDAFFYYPSEHVDRLFVAAYDSLAAEHLTPNASYSDLTLEWKAFRDGVLVTHPTGEMPNVTDSGYAFDRRARQLLGIDQSQIMEPSDVITSLLSAPSGMVIFVDDFVGSGDQFVNTWYRDYDINGKNISFASLSTQGSYVFYYIPLICTSDGASVIESTCQGVSLRPTHVLPRSYSVQAVDSIVWPEHLRASGPTFVEAASRRAGIAAGRIWGYGGLGLTMAFEHGVPDATIPLFHFEENGWSPLVRLR